MDPISSIYNWRRLTPEDGHYFFGYYDRNPWNADQSLHLMMKIDQCERLPLPGETAEIGTVTPKGEYRKLTETRAWCHQQGSMELFHPLRKDCIIYNDFDTGTGRLQARIFKMGEGEVGRYSDPVYALAPNGKFAVSLDIGRIPRRGYSYADVPVGDDLHPANCDEEGLFMIDLETGKKSMIASYSAMLEQHPCRYTTEGRYIWLNHAIVNCDSTRVLWLFRQTNDQYKVRGWQTFMYTSDLNGSDIRCTLPEPFWTRQISHQIWGRTTNEILIDANWDGTGHHAIVFDENEYPFRAKKIADSHGIMSHMIFSPDGTKMLADSYPDLDGIQHLALIDVATGKSEIIGHFNHKPERPNIGETRCDIHPRWSPDGRYVTVDSIHDGKFRGCYLLEL